MTGSRPRILKRRVLCSTPFFTVVEENLAPEASGYWFLETADWVNVVAVTAAQDLLMVSQYRHARREWTLEVPAGAIGPAESAVEAGLRELHEETGYVGESARIVAERSVNPALQTTSLTTVLIEDVHKTEPGEHEVRLIPLEVWSADNFAREGSHLFTALATHDAMMYLSSRMPIRGGHES